MLIAGEAFAGNSPTNPPHVFEIHPITQLNGSDLSDSLHLIDGYDSKSPDDAFEHYESSTFQLSPAQNGRVAMRMQMVGYNYVHFVMQLIGKDATADDGEFVFAQIRNDTGEVLVNKLRVGFLKGSQPYTAEQSMGTGQCLKLLGIPRVDLALVSWRLKHAQADPSILSWSLPYEMIAVGVDGNTASCSESGT
jgi:hypothetical protein